MFVNAIQKVGGYTRAIHSISRLYIEDNILPGAATLFFVNNEGYAVTCKHVAELIIQAEKINSQYENFKRDLNSGMSRNEVQAKYNFRDGALLQIKHNFVNCFDKVSGFDCLLHPVHDLAILVFKGFTKTYYNGFARFIGDDESIQQGKSLCRLGYPFPEFNNFIYDKSTEDIMWTNKGNPYSPTFPIDGIVTRLIRKGNEIVGVEMSTPGLKGQSGGPLFDQEGLIYGMQSSTAHMHLGFDLVDHPVGAGNRQKTVNNFPFLHVGRCVHADVIKKFLKDHGVKFFTN